MNHYISYLYAIEVHDYLIEEYGGRKGIVNEGLLRSAWAYQNTSNKGTKEALRLVGNKLFYS